MAPPESGVANGNISVIAAVTMEAVGADPIRVALRFAERLRGFEIGPR
jgi:hypothetical protein